MGIADAVPGVSGGTIALIVGIYDRLIGAITAVTFRRVGRFFRATLRGDLSTAAMELIRMDVPFLLVILSGILTAVITVSHTMAIAVTTYPVPTFSFFFGLIAASGVILLQEVTIDRPRHYVAAISGFLIAALISGSELVTYATTPLSSFFTGALAVSAMVLPGISGSLILLILGQYTPLISALSTFISALGRVATGGSLNAVIASGDIVVAFGLGAVIGVLTVAHLVKWAFNHDPDSTMAFLVSLVIGALRAPIERILQETTPTVDVIIVMIIAAVAGAMAVIILERVGGVGIPTRR